MGYAILKAADKTAEAFIVSGATALAITIWGHSWTYLTGQSWGYVASSEFAKKCMLLFTIERCAFFIIKKLQSPTDDQHYSVLSGLSISCTLGLFATHYAPEEAFKWLAIAVAIYAIPRLIYLCKQENLKNLPTN